MAKEYHPLDVRYKGPSTAYTGSHKLQDPQRGFQPADPPARPVPDPAPRSTQGPWAAVGSGPAPQPRRALSVTDSPPPLPQRSARPARRRNSGIRVLIGLLIMAAIVGGNIVAMRNYNGLVTDVNSQINAVELPSLDL